MESRTGSEFLEHIPCEKCGSSDAAAVYDDGHIHCFSCGRTYGGNGGIRKETKRVSFTPIEGTYAPLQKRGISEEICKKFGYTVGNDGRQPVQIANYYDEARKLVGQKIRTPGKDFYVKGAVSAHLFASHLWGSGGKRIVITEGEIDALSYATATKGEWPVVSVPNGAQGAKKALQQHMEWLETYDEIVIAFDNDEPGQAAARDCAHLFTPGKCKVARLDPNYKDFNDALRDGGIRAILTAVWNAQELRPDGIVAGDDLWEVVSDTTVISSYDYPWKGLNRVTHGIRKGELVTLTAGSGIGKSAFCREIAYDLAVKQGARVGCLFLEENVRRTALGIMGIAANSPLHLHGVTGDDPIDPELLKEAYEQSLDTGRFYFLDHFGSTDMDNLISRIRYLALGCDVDFVVLDHISIVISGLDVQDERRAIDMAMTELRTLVERTGIGLILVSHLKRPQGDQGHENGIDPQLAHLRGSHAIAQLSDMVIGLSRDQQCDDGKRDDTKLLVLKNRFSGETGYAGMVTYDHATGRLAEKADDASLERDFTDEEMF